ncbi:Eukaryotic/viral aspartic protease, partial [Phytophthora megakarya]
MSVYAYVAKRSRDEVSRCTAALNDNTCESKMVRTALERAPRVSAIRSTDEYARETPLNAIDLQPGERRGYWKHCAPDKWYKQAKIHGKLNNRKAVLLLDTGAEVSILDATFAREVGCQIDTSVTQECVGIRDETYFTVGKTRVKDTLAGNMVYHMDLWVGDLVGQNASFGMNLMKNAPRLWVTRGTAWVTSVIRAPVGRHMCLRVTNIMEKSVVLDAHTTVGWWTPVDSIP